MRGELIGVALVLAVGMAAHAYLSTPRYGMVRLDENTVMKLDRWNGETSMCAQWTKDDGSQNAYCQLLTDWEEIKPVAPDQ